MSGVRVGVGMRGGRGDEWGGVCLEMEGVGMEYRVNTGKRRSTAGSVGKMVKDYLMLKMQYACHTLHYHDRYRLVL